MLRNSAVDLWRALVGLSAEKSIVVPLRRSPLNSSRKVNSSILGASSLFRFDDDVFFRPVTHDPRQRHLFLFRDCFERFVEIGWEADRRADPGRALSLRAFSLSLFRLHRWPASITVFTTVHHGGESASDPVDLFSEGTPTSGARFQ